MHNFSFKKISKKYLENSNIFEFSTAAFFAALFVLVFLFSSSAVEAEYFKSGLKEYITNDHQIKTPVFQPVETIELRTVSEAVLYSGQQKITLSPRENYFIMFYDSSSEAPVFSSESSEQNESRAAESAESNGDLSSDEKAPEWLQLDSEAEQSIQIEKRYAVQLFASSYQEKAEELQKELELETDFEITILNEDGLYKLLAGAFKEREAAENAEIELQEMDYQGWIKEFDYQFRRENSKAEGNQGTADLDSSDSTDIEQQDKAIQTAAEESGEKTQPEKMLALYNSEGELILKGEKMQLEGSFEAKGNELYGDFELSLLNKQIMIKAVSDLETLTASLLKNYFRTDADREALKAQAVVFRTALLYQLQAEGEELGTIEELSFSYLEPAYRNAAEETAAEVLVSGDDFYYNSNYQLRQISKPRAGLSALAQADYSYQEIIDYYYGRAKIKSLRDLRDSQIKYTARITYGLKFKELRQFDWNGPRLITILDYDLNVDRLKLKPVLAKGIVPGREDLADIIKSNQALAGVNGGYFHYTGRPLGLLYIDGQLVSEPLYKRTALLIDKDGEISFAPVDWEGSLELSSYGLQIKLDGVNRAAAAGEAVLFNSYYGRQVPELKENYYDIVVRSGEILGVENKAGSKTALAPDGFVLRVQKDKEAIVGLIPELKGKAAELKMEFTPDFEAADIVTAVGGGPRLLSSGEINITGSEEKFQSDVLKNRSPRTAVGITDANHLIMLTVDGRQQTNSVGMSLRELASTLKELDVVDAMNLDGGGSARMVIRGFTMNNPSEERLISSGILVDDKK